MMLATLNYCQDRRFFQRTNRKYIHCKQWQSTRLLNRGVFSGFGSHFMQMAYQAAPSCQRLWMLQVHIQWNWWTVGKLTKEMFWSEARDGKVCTYVIDVSSAASGVFFLENTLSLTIFANGVAFYGCVCMDSMASMVSIRAFRSILSQSCFFLSLCIVEYTIVLNFDINILWWRRLHHNGLYLLTLTVLYMIFENKQYWVGH